MTILGKAALIEQAAKVLDPWEVTHHNGCHGEDDWGNSLSVKDGAELAAAALPVIAKALLAPLRIYCDTLPGQFSRELERLLDAIEAEVSA